MLRDKEEVFRVLWENREALEIDEKGYLEVQSVRPCALGPMASAPGNRRRVCRDPDAHGR